MQDAKPMNEKTKRVDTVSSGVDRPATTDRQTVAAASGEAKTGTNLGSWSNTTADRSSGAANVGDTVDNILQKAGRLAPLEALRYLTPLTSVLGSLHAAKQAHGALSLDVMRVTKGDDGALRLQLLKGRQPQPTLRDANPKAALAGRMVLYSSPGQIQGATPSEFDDMYAVGLLAYTLLVGEPYWAEEVDRLAFMALCKTILNGPPEAPSVRASRRKSVRLPQDFDAWFVLVTDRKHPDHFQDITDAGIALTSVLSNPDIRELSRSVQFKFNPNILDLPAVADPSPSSLPDGEPENLRFTALFAIIASVSVALAIVMLLRWSNAHETSTQQPPQAPSSAIDTATPNHR